MRDKLFSILTLLLHHTTHACSYGDTIQGSPEWGFLCYPGCLTGGYNFIPVASTTSHVTGIQLVLTTSGAIYSVNILGDGVSRTPILNGACSTLSGNTHTLTVAANQRVTIIEAYRNSDEMWYRLKIIFNDGAFQEYNPTHDSSSDTLYTYTIPSGKEFTGFAIYGPSSGCKIAWIAVCRRPTCGISINLSGVSGQSQDVITDPTKTIAFTSTSSPDCNSATIEYQVTVSPASTTFNLITIPTSTNPTIQFAHSTNIADAQTYTLTVMARPTGTTVWLSPTTATYTYIVPCSSTTLNPITLTAMTTSVLKQIPPGGSPYYEQQTVTPTNSLSVSANNPTCCGGYQFSISSEISTGSIASQALTSTELSIDSAGTIQLYTTSKNAVGTHTATVTVSMINYSSKTRTAVFTITIDPCQLTSFTMAALSNQFYTIGDSELIWPTSVVTQVPACDYNYQLTTSSVSTILQIAPAPTIQFSVQSRDLSNAGTFLVSVTATLDNYSYTASPISCQQQFTLTVTDPCLTTQITTVPASVENMVVFANYSSTSKVRYTFNDTISITKTLTTDSNDFCGEKTLAFSLNGTTTTYLHGSNSGYFYFSPLVSIQEFGVSQATVQASMKNYPQIKSSPISFTATILKSIVPSIDDKTYILGTSPLSIEYSLFQVLPSSYDSGLKTIKAFIFNGGQLPEKIDLLCDCLTSIQNMDWIAFVSEEKLIVQTSSEQYVGSHRIVLIQLLENFPDVLPFTSFIVNIQKTPEVLKSKPPYFEYDLTTKTVTQQCQDTGKNLWSFDLPEIIDPNNRPVSLTASFDSKFFEFNESTQKISQISEIDSSVNKTLVFELKNELNRSASYTMQVIFICSTSVTISNYTTTSQKQYSMSKTKIPFPVKIKSISRKGVVEVQFFLSVQVPNFTKTTNSTDTSYQRKLKEDVNILPLDQLVNKSVLSVQMQTQYDLTDLDWWCTDYTNHSLQLQLNFPDPMQVSQRHQDQLVITFKQTDQFVLSDRDEYLFQNDSQKTIIHTIPTQLPSESAQVVFRVITASVEQVGYIVVVITLMVQIIAKKTITYVWFFYCALQIVLLLAKRSNIVLPASVEIVIDSISGIINLSQLDKQKIASILHLETIMNSEVYQALDGVALSLIGILLLLLVVGITIFISRKSPKVQAFVIKIRNTIFWNFLIRYFQAAFIGFNFAALSVVQQPGSGFKDIGTSVIILVIHYSLVCLITYTLVKKDLKELNQLQTREKIGNLYYNLDTTQRKKVLFGLFFYFQRCILIILMSIKQDFSIQWQLCQLTLLMNNCYLLTVKPYQDQSTFKLDLINCFFLIVTTILISTYSAWNIDPLNRFKQGLVFDAVLGLHFIVNFVYVGNQLVRQLILKLKQMKLRYKKRKRYSKTTEINKTKANTIARDAASVTEQDRIKPNNNTSQPQKLKKEQKMRTRKSQRQSIQELLERISELSENSESNFESEANIIQKSYKYRKNQKSSKVKRWRPPTPMPRKDKSKQEGNAQQEKVRSQELDYFTFNNDLKKASIPQSLEYSRYDLNQNNYLRQPDRAQIFRQNDRIQDQIHSNSYGIKSYDGIRHPKLGLKSWQIQQHLNSQPLGLEKQYGFRANQPVSNRQIIPFSENILTRQQEQKVEQTHLPKQKEIKPRQDLTNSNLIALKTKKKPILTFLQFRKAPKSFNFFVPANRARMDFIGKEREFLQKTSDNYFAAQHQGVRCYKKGEKNFTWMSDVWPFYRQTMEHNYSGPYISEEQHIECVKVHLYQQWTKEYPKKPYLPLMVSVDLYNRICDEIAPYVLDYVAGKQLQKENKIR